MELRMEAQFDIKPDLMVHARGEGNMGGAKGIHIGTVDHLDGQYIKLKKSDSKDGKHHWIPLSCVEKVDKRAVYLNMTAAEAEDSFIDERPLH
jgi:hypothetical protein